MNIIPRPQKVEELNGKIAFSNKTVIEGDFASTIAFAKSYLADIDGDDTSTLTFNMNDKLADEEYKITCDGDKINVESSDETGAFYAFQTLRQVANNGNYIVAVNVEDKPKYKHRGFMLDSARHFWTTAKVKQFLDVMANIKMNVFHWHLTDDQGWRIEIKKYPLLATKGSIRKDTPLLLKGYGQNKEPHDGVKYGEGCYYSQDELREIVEYAKNLHINIIPEIDMPGHMVAAIACYPELSCTGEATEVSNRWGIMDNILCIPKPNVMQFVHDVIDEVVDIFPYKYFHIGGDEVPKKRWKENELCQKMIQDLGLKNENALQGYFNNEIAKYLRTKGRCMIGWNEILDGQDVMDKDIIAQWWVHRPFGDKNEKNWMAKGGKVILSICNYIYMDHSYGLRPLQKTYKFSSSAVSLSDESSVVGMEIPQWTEYIRDEEKLDIMTYPRLLAFSEVCWTNDNIKDYNDFEGRLEAMRDYFKKAFGFTVAHQKVYRGKTQPWYVLNAYKFWGAHPYFEVEQNKLLMK